MGWYSRRKKTFRRSWNKTRRGFGRVKNTNDEYDIVGLSPNNLISPIDFTPAGWVSKGYKAGKYARTGYQLGRRGMSTYGRTAYRSGAKKAGDAASSLSAKGYSRNKKNSKKGRSRASSPNRRTSQTRGGSSRYYWYKGKRYERKYKR